MPLLPSHSVSVRGKRKRCNKVRKGRKKDNKKVLSQPDSGDIFGQSVKEVRGFRPNYQLLRTAGAEGATSTQRSTSGEEEKNQGLCRRRSETFLGTLVELYS